MDAAVKLFEDLLTEDLAVETYKYLNQVQSVDLKPEISGYSILAVIDDPRKAIEQIVHKAIPKSWILRKMLKCQPSAVDTKAYHLDVYNRKEKVCYVVGQHTVKHLLRLWKPEGVNLKINNYQQLARWMLNSNPMWLIELYDMYTGEKFISPIRRKYSTGVLQYPQLRALLKEEGEVRKRKEDHDEEVAYYYEWNRGL